ncbi:MAG TPA: hypothetical protein VN766_04665 [Stellaceae bacterium]|jgi:hypothetical protein|nr:hypothetical protein [Stellaceae bacterium]
MSITRSLASDADLPATTELEHDLLEIQRLLRILPSLSSGDEDLDDILWLRDRQRFLRSIIASRREWQRQKIVSFAHWRRGALPADASLSHAA